MNENPGAESPRRLWDKGTAVRADVLDFTVGDDPVQDLHLAAHDCIASAAHARTLHRAALLDETDLAALLGALAALHADATAGRFAIPRELEDVHTALEAELTRRCGAAGERIHTGRSRNDQVATAMRLFLRDAAQRHLGAVLDVCRACLRRIETDGAAPLPGYTHLQPAMPSSIGQWLHAFVEGLLDQVRAGEALTARLDCCPLGTGAGYGVPLPLDREFTAKLLGFSRVQRSAPDVQNGRGRFERDYARLVADSAAILEKLACDVVLFVSAEFGFFALPESLTTGSSIMPQKRNPDVAELLRAHCARARTRAMELEWVTAKLTSGYHRDLQLTKAPVFAASADSAAICAIASLLVSSLTVNLERLKAAMRPELYAAQAAYRLVRQGVPFRQAYSRVAEQIRGGTFVAPAPRPDDVRPEIVAPSLLAELTAECNACAARLAQRRAAVDSQIFRVFDCET